LNCKVELKEFFPEGVAARLPDAGVAPRSGQEHAYRQNLEGFLREDPAARTALTSFRANGSAYLVMENVKELGIESPLGSGRIPVMDAPGVPRRPNLSSGGGGFRRRAPPQAPAPPFPQQPQAPSGRGSNGRPHSSLCCLPAASCLSSSSDVSEKHN